MFKLFNSNYLINTFNYISRNYATKIESKIKWVRPAKVEFYMPEKTGDGSGVPEYDNNEFLSAFQKSKELQSADDLVKSMFRLKNNPFKETTYYLCTKSKDSVKRHDFDSGSMETAIAKLTIQIRSIREIMIKYPRNKIVKVHLLRLIGKRRRYLRHLRRWDYKRFEWILDKFDLVYKPNPTIINEVSRKASLTNLTKLHCQDIREKRLADYRTVLQSKQLDFLKRKIENLEFIRKEQIECQLPVTVSENEIKQVQKQYQELKSAREKEENK